VCLSNVFSLYRSMMCEYRVVGASDKSLRGVGRRWEVVVGREVSGRGFGGEGWF
jgi:hypothetical protein